jgi:hypothetical protein
MKRNFNRRNNFQNTVDPNNVTNPENYIAPEKPKDPDDFCSLPPRPPPVDHEEEKRQYIKQLINEYQNAVIVVRELRTELRQIGVNPDMYTPQHQS